MKFCYYLGDIMVKKSTATSNMKKNAGSVALSTADKLPFFLLNMNARATSIQNFNALIV